MCLQQKVKSFKKESNFVHDQHNSDFLCILIIVLTDDYPDESYNGDKQGSGTKKKNGKSGKVGVLHMVNMLPWQYVVKIYVDRYELLEKGREFNLFSLILKRSKYFCLFSQICNEFILFMIVSLIVKCIGWYNMIP